MRATNLMVNFFKDFSSKYLFKNEQTYLVTYTLTQPHRHTQVYSHTHTHTHVLSPLSNLTFLCFKYCCFSRYYPQSRISVRLPPSGHYLLAVSHHLKV